MDTKQPAYMYPIKAVSDEYERLAEPIRQQMERLQVEYGEKAAALLGVRVGQTWKTTRAVREHDTTLYECYSVFTIARIAYVDDYEGSHIRVWVDDALPPIDGTRLEAILVCEKVKDS